MATITIRKFIICTILFLSCLLLNTLVHQSVFEIALLQKNIENPTIEQIDTTYSDLPANDSSRGWKTQKPLQNGQGRESVPPRKENLHVQKPSVKSPPTQKSRIFSKKFFQEKQVKVTSSSKFPRSKTSGDKESDFVRHADVPFPFNICWDSIQRGEWFSASPSEPIEELSSIHLVEPLPILEMEEKKTNTPEEISSVDLLAQKPLEDSYPSSIHLIQIPKEKEATAPEKFPSSPPPPSPETSDWVEKLSQTVSSEAIPSQDLLGGIERIEIFDEIPLLEKAPHTFQVGRNVGKKFEQPETGKTFSRLAQHVTGPGMNTNGEGEIVPLQKGETAPPGIRVEKASYSSPSETSLPTTDLRTLERMELLPEKATVSAKPILEGDHVLGLLSVEDLGEKNPIPPTPELPDDSSVQTPWHRADIAPHFGLSQPVRIGQESPSSPGLVLLPDETGLVRKEVVNFPPVE